MTSKINLKTLFTMPMAPPPNKLSLHAKQFDGKTKERQCCARFYGGYCSLWPNRTARSLSRAWPSLLRAHNHIGGATAVPLHHKKCLLCSVLIYIVLDLVGNSYFRPAQSSKPFDSSAHWLEPVGNWDNILYAEFASSCDLHLHGGGKCRVGWGMEPPLRENGRI